MRWNNVIYGMLLVFIFTGLLRTDAGVGKPYNPQSQDPVWLIQSDDNGVTFEFVTLDYTLEAMPLDEGFSHSLGVDGYGQTDKIGYPQLPMTSVSIGIPIDARVQISIIYDEIINIQNIWDLTPVPKTISASDDTGKINYIYSKDSTAYQQNTFYPDSPVIAGEYGWLRDQHYVQVMLFPFQYNPLEGTLIWHKRMTVQVIILVDNIQSENNADQIHILEEHSSFDSLLREQILNYEEARSWRTQPPVEAAHLTSVNGERLRISIEKDGIYRISYTDLVLAGFGGTDPGTYQMSNQGREVALQVVGEDDGSLDEGDYILFYGEAYRGDNMAAWYVDEANNWITYTTQLTDGSTTTWHPEFTAEMMEKYSTENVYWLQEALGELPARMDIVDGTPGDAEVPLFYHATAHAEVQWERYERHYTSEDTWFWQYVMDTNEWSYSKVLTGIYTEPFTATVRSEYVSRTYSYYVSPDHHLRFRINNRVDPIYEAYWDGASRHSFEVEVPSTDLVEGINRLYMTIVEDDTVDTNVMFDWYEIDYLRRFMAVNDSIAFPGEITGTWRYKIEGFNQEGVQVYDITDPHLPKQVNNISTYLDGTYWAEFQYTQEAGAKFLAVNNNSVLSPKSITLYTPPDLRSTSNGADYLIISHAEFLETAQTLGDYRSNQGLRVRIINIEDLYNEFNEGIRHPIAIKNFLKYTFLNWTPPAPLYVVLVGDGHWDLLDTGYTYTTTPVYIPPNLSWVDPLQGEVDSSNLLATIVGSDPLPDIFIGRVPVNTPLEFQNVINKIIVFETTQNQPWQLNNTFIADNTPDAVGNFPAMADYIINEYIEPGFTPIRIYEDDFGCISPTTTPAACSAVTAEILNTINNTGTLFNTYVGHASVQNWSHERIFVLNNISSLTNTNQLPIVLSMDCLDGYWFHPTLQPSMAEMFIRTANYGAAATFSPTGLGVGLGHYTLMEGFFGAVYRDGLWEMGAATLGAKLALYNAGYFRDMLHTYTTFGDPALKFPSPYDLTVSPEQAAQQAVPGTQLTYPIQVSNTGTLPDTIEITVEGNTWPTTPAASLLSLGAGETIDVLITVDIPADIPGGVTDTALVQVSSDGDAAELKTVSLNSTALVWVRLPMMRK